MRSRKLKARKKMKKCFVCKKNIPPEDGVCFVFTTGSGQKVRTETRYYHKDCVPTAVLEKAFRVN